MLTEIGWALLATDFPFLLTTSRTFVHFIELLSCPTMAAEELSMFHTKEESGCLIVESSLKFLSMPLQVSGVGLLFASMMLLPVFNALIGLAFAIVGAALLACGFKLQRSREFVFDPYLKRVFWKHCEGAGSHEGSVAFADISHVLIESHPVDADHAGLSLLVGSEKMPVLGELKSVAPAQRRDMEKLAEKIKRIVGAY